MEESVGSATEDNVIALHSAYLSGSLEKRAFLEAMHGEHRRLYAYRRLLQGSNLAKIEILADGVRIAFKDPSIMLWCPESDRRAAPIEALNFGDYETAEFGIVRTLIERLRNRALTIIDVGANVGFYSLGLASLLPKATLHAFEPVPDTFAQLEANVRLNGFTNVKIYPIGLGSKAEVVEFFTYPTQSVAASRERILEDVPAQPVRCELRTLDQVRREIGFRADFLKCDVEGAERFVFEGGTETLREDRPIIFSEMLRKWSARYGYHPNDLIADLRTFGYDCYAITRNGLTVCSNVTEDTLETNFIFLDREKHQGLAADFTPDAIIR